MAKRYFLSPIIGTGTIGDPYRAKTSGANHAALIPSNPDGTPKYTYALCLMSASSLATLLADITLSALPDRQVGDLLSSVEATQINSAMLTRLNLTTVVNSGDSFGTALHKVGLALDPKFDETQMRIG